MLSSLDPWGVCGYHNEKYELIWQYLHYLLLAIMRIENNSLKHTAYHPRLSQEMRAR